MKDKEKQIEEIAQCKNSYGITCSDCDGKKACGRYILAKELIDKDSVVLMREEYEKGKQDYNYQIHRALVEEGRVDKARKETAEKIIDIIKTFCPDKKFIETITHIIVERFGVEIKEN